MKYLSVCSGIEAASVAWEGLGWEPVAFSEIEPFPSAVLKYRFPNVPNLGDMTRFKEWPIAAGSFQLLVGGTPCQAFSVAGLRKGLEDPRGNLMLTFGAIAGHFRPTWIVWENVPGVLSSNGGRDFGSFFGMLGELGYGVAYRVLDAQYFGVAQRRRRVFVVGYLGDWRRAAAVLFESESMRGNPPPSREKREGVAGSLASRSSAGGGLGTDFDLAGGLQPVGTSVQPQPSGWVSQDDRAYGDVVRPLEAVGGYHVHDGRGRGGGDLIPTLCSDHAGRPSDFSPVVFDTTQVTSKANRSNPSPGDPSHPLAAGAHPPLLARTLSARHDGSPCADRGPDVVPVMPINTQVITRARSLGESTGFGLGEDGDPAFTLQAGHSHGVYEQSGVRRLTPRECERLQGFPDDWTLIPWRGKLAPDGPRYKACGNSMAVPVMRWIGQHIEAEK